MLADLYFKARQSRDGAVAMAEGAPPRTAAENPAPETRGPPAPPEPPSRQFVTSAELFGQRERVLASSSTTRIQPSTPHRPPAPAEASIRVAPSVDTAVAVDNIPLPAPETFSPVEPSFAGEDSTYVSARVAAFSGSDSYNTANGVVHRLKEIAGPRALQSTDEEFDDIAAARRTAFFRTLFTTQSSSVSPVLSVSSTPPCGNILSTYNGGYGQTIDTLTSIRQMLQ